MAAAGLGEQNHLKAAVAQSMMAKLSLVGMSDDDYEFDPVDLIEEVAHEKPRDRKIDEAKAVIMQKFFSGETDVYYARQIHIWLEREFFHWITGRALNELVGEGKIGFRTATVGHTEIHFYYPKRHRYPARQIKEILGLIAEFSDPLFTRALGSHGELLVAAGFATIGFRVVKRKVREVDGVRWTDSNHDLDYLIERDGVRYGVEVKNQLGYIDQTEFEIKSDMCAAFRIRPLFICRQMPKNYVSKVYKQDGYCLITQNQNYPPLAENLAKRVRETLNLPVATITALPDTALVRFDRFHSKA